MCIIQALAQALGGDASMHLMLGMLRTSKGKPEAAADAYAAAVRISLVCLSPTGDQEIPR